MALDLMVHLFMLAVFTVVVLEDDNGSLSKTEIALTFHVMVSTHELWCVVVESFVEVRD